MKSKNKPSASGGATRSGDAPGDTVDAVPAPLGAKPSDYDARLTRFLDELVKLSEEQWATAATRFLAEKKSIMVTSRNVDHIMADLSGGKIKPFGRTQSKQLMTVRQANTVMNAATTHLPAAREIDGNAIAFQDAAYLAMYHAVNALKVFGELDRIPGGRKVLRTLLAPFDDFTTDVLS